MPIITATMFVNLGICIAIALTVYFTKNPLAVIALFFLQPEPAHQFLTSDGNTDAVGDGDGHDDDYGGSTIGFHTKIK